MEDARAARAFATARPRAILFALMQSEHWLQSVHATLGLSLSLHYHVSRLVALDLVHIVQRQARAGPAIAAYAAAARSFNVPAHLEAASPGTAIAVELQALLEGAWRRGRVRGTVYCLDEQQMPRMQRLAAASPADEGEWWWRLRLSEADAQKLGRDIRALAASYREHAAQTGRDYLAILRLDELERREVVAGPGRKRTYRLWPKSPGRSLRRTRCNGDERAS